MVRRGVINGMGRLLEKERKENWRRGSRDRMGKAG